MRGQASMEFMIFAGFSFLILVTLISAVSLRQTEYVQRSNFMDAREVEQNVAFQVEMAQAQGPGYSRVVSYPARIAGKPYLVDVTQNSVVVDWQDNTRIGSTIYSGRDISFQVDGSTDIRFLHNETGVFAVDE